MTPLSLSLWVYGIVWDAFQQFLKYQQQKPYLPGDVPILLRLNFPPLFDGQLALEDCFFYSPPCFQFS
jgi:hypothetical protein